MPLASYRVLFWLSIVLAQAGAFIIFKDLADISQWLVQSSREFTMSVWYNRHVLGGVSAFFFLVSTVLWWRNRSLCNTTIMTFLVLIFCFNFYSGMINPKLMFRSQQHQAMFVPVAEATHYLQRSIDWARFGEESYDSVDDISMVVLETDDGAYAYSNYYLLQPHVVKANSVGGEEVIMTYCGLTNLAIAYSPVIQGQALDLTVMTQLKNNLVMFDKNSGEAIQQITGVLERAPEKGKLKEWPTVRMPFSSFKHVYPDGKVFINEIPAVSENPVIAAWDTLVRHGMMYWGVGLQWINKEKPAFPTVDFQDRRLPMKQLVYALNVGDDYVAYTREFIQLQGGIINVDIGNKPVVISYDEAFDSVTAFFNSTGTSVNEVDLFGRTANGEQLERVNTLKSNLFWFIFAEFFPGTDVNRVS